ncbi:UNVERIFIED_ORG: ACS family tartrate transporter-like MFS transporter [Burkholderia sp. CF145]
MRSIEPIERETIRRVAFRLIPLLMLGYFCAYLDRSNVGMAATTMVKGLGLTNSVFGFGAGLFFLGYFLAEIPSNLMLDKVGARRWLARILLTWGIISGLTAFVWSESSFYANRLLLGLAEAGFYPGVVLYLTWWFPSSYRTRMMAIFQSSSTISLFIGPPIGSLLLNMQGTLGLHGWQWLYLIEGLPPVLLSVVMWKFLSDRPASAKWLKQDQKEWLIKRLQSERAEQETVRKFSLGQALSNPTVWAIAVAYIGTNMISYGLAFFLPLIVKGLGVPTSLIGLVSAIPYLCAFGAMLIWGWHSDRTGERTWHVALPCLLCAVGLASVALIGLNHPVLTMVAITIGVVGLQSLQSPFWAVPSSLLTGKAAAGGLAMINAIGALGGMLGPWLFGTVRDATGSDSIGLLCLAAAPVISAILIIVVGQGRRTATHTVAR